MNEESKRWWHIAFNNANDMVEFINKHNLKSDEFKYSDCGIGWPYSILYYSDIQLW